MKLNIDIIAYITDSINKVNDDLQGSEQINKSMIEFLTAHVFGNQGWLHLHELKKLRREQKNAFDKLYDSSRSRGSKSGDFKPR